MSTRGLVANELLFRALYHYEFITVESPTNKDGELGNRSFKQDANVITQLDVGLQVELNPYWTTDVLIFNVLNMDRKTGEFGPMNGISLSDIHVDL